MPYGNKYRNRTRRNRKYRRKRKYRRGKSSGLRNSLIPRYTTLKNNRVGFPNAMVTKMRYSDVISINATSGLIGTHVFRANGLYDPDLTGTGHQPLGFDQFMGVMYNHYCVLGSKITIQPIGQSGTAEAHEVSLVLSDVNNVSSLGSNDLREQPNCITQLFGNLAGDGGGQPKKMYGKFSMKKFFRRGVEKDLSGTTTSDPSEQAYWIICSNAVPSSGDASNVNFRVIIDYIVLLTEPRQLTQS